MPLNIDVNHLAEILYKQLPECRLTKVEALALSKKAIDAIIENRNRRFLLQQVSETKPTNVCGT